MFDLCEAVENLSENCPKCQFSDNRRPDRVGLLTASDAFCRKWWVLANSSVVNVVRKSSIFSGTHETFEASDQAR